jgi:hypothetical protein
LVERTAAVLSGRTVAVLLLHEPPRTQVPWPIVVFIFTIVCIGGGGPGAGGRWRGSGGIVTITATAGGLDGLEPGRDEAEVRPPGIDSSQLQTVYFTWGLSQIMGLSPHQHVFTNGTGIVFSKCVYWEMGTPLLWE